MKRGVYGAEGKMLHVGNAAIDGSRIFPEKRVNELDTGCRVAVSSV
jgi:hypothetical protein